MMIMAKLRPFKNKSIVINFRITESDSKAIEKVGRASNVRTSDILRYALEQYLSGNDYKYDHLVRQRDKLTEAKRREALIKRLVKAGNMILANKEYRNRWNRALNDEYTDPKVKAVLRATQDALDKATTEHMNALIQEFHEQGMDMMKYMPKKLKGDPNNPFLEPWEKSLRREYAKHNRSSETVRGEDQGV